MPTRKKPSLGKAPSKTRLPVVDEVPPPRRFVFSYRYFRQLKYFEIGALNSGWFLAFFEKMTEISSKDFDALMTNFREKNAWRLHKIDWNHRSVPYQRNALNWIDRRYIENEEEFPFFQFQITKAFGRVIGFWDETGTFNVVFLDPMHNMQPSAHSDYKLREGVLAKSHFDAAICVVESVISACGTDCKCRPIYGKIQEALTASLPFETALVPMTADIFQRATACIQDGLADALSDILDLGLRQLEY